MNPRTASGPCRSRTSHDWPVKTPIRADQAGQARRGVRKPRATSPPSGRAAGRDRPPRSPGCARRFPTRTAPHLQRLEAGPQDEDRGGIFPNTPLDTPIGHHDVPFFRIIFSGAFSRILRFNGESNEDLVALLRSRASRISSLATVYRRARTPPLQLRCGRCGRPVVGNGGRHDHRSDEAKCSKTAGLDLGRGTDPIRRTPAGAGRPVGPTRGSRGRRDCARPPQRHGPPPKLRLETYRTASMSSIVGPAVTNTVCRPAGTMCAPPSGFLRR